MILAILQARTSSSRLPGKVLKPILGQPMLLHQIERIRRSQRISALVLATSVDASDDALAATVEAAGVPVFRGSLDDVLARFAGAADLYPEAETIVRLTGDCPLTDWQVLDAAIARFEAGEYDYLNNCEPPTWPDGLDVEVMRRNALTAANAEATKLTEREHVTPFIRNRPERFRLGNMANGADLSALRWTVDEPADFAFVTAVYERLYPHKPDFLMGDILDLIATEPALAGNAHIMRNEGYLATLARERQAVGNASAS